MKNPQWDMKFGIISVSVPVIFAELLWEGSELYFSRGPPGTLAQSLSSYLLSNYFVQYCLRHRGTS